MPALHELTASALAALTRAGEVSCREAVKAHLLRIDAVNPRVNAVTVVLREAALAAADGADRSGERGPLHGVPFTVKENLDCLGSPTTQGLSVGRGAMPYLDAPAVARLKAAGAIAVGRANLSELGMRFDTDNPLRGRTRNPWDPKLSAGGSSGGDAVAVATGMVPLGLGNDMGGSLRIPAAACGVAALKPTTGRVANASSLEPQDLGWSSTLMSNGPLARSVADLRLALAVLAGRDGRDSRSVDVPLVGRPPEERRAALVVEVPGGPLPAPVIAAIRRAGALLAAAGWAVEETAAPEVVRANELWGRIVASDVSAVLPMLRPFLSEALQGHIARLVRWADRGERSSHWLHVERARLTRVWSAFLAQRTVTIGPTWAAPPWPTDADLDPERGIALIEETARFVLPMNLVGAPALALPMGVEHGLPVGVQIVADLWREDLCLLAAEIIEAGAPMPTPIDPRSP